MKNRRNKPDRREFSTQQDRSGKDNRRTRPDRRLNDIQAVWIPFSSVRLHPQTRSVFGRLKSLN